MEKWLKQCTVIEFLTGEGYTPIRISFTICHWRHVICTENKRKYMENKRTNSTKNFKMGALARKVMMTIFYDCKAVVHI